MLPRFPYTDMQFLQLKLGLIFTPFPTELKLCYPIGFYVRAFAFFAKCMIMYCEQMTGLGSVKFCVHLHVDNFHSATDFRQNCQLHFQSQKFEQSTLGSLYVIISQTATYNSNIAMPKKGSHMWPFDKHIYIWYWPILKVRVKVIHILLLLISHKRRQIGKIIATANKW